MFRYFGILILNYILLDRFASSNEHIPQINLEKYLQSNYVGVNSTFDEISNDRFACPRNCTLNPEPRLCYYRFTVEQYHTMGPACDGCPMDPQACRNPQCVQADGIERTVLTVNRMINGPAIIVCYGDRIIVDVHNKMPARDLTIHWHGELQQKSPWEDGVPFVSQCPIPENTKFRYDFYANTPGTHFYHTHSGLQLFDGLSGPLLVRMSKEIEPIANLYDEDHFSHFIQVQDWMHTLVDNKYPGANKNLTLITLKPESYIINGKGSYTNPITMEVTGTPWAEFDVKPNRRYRFRVINTSSSTCSAKFTFEAHKMLLIAIDGYPIQPVEVRNLYLVAGDVFDVVIITNQTPRPYWIRVQGVGDCIGAYQYAILSYDGFSMQIPPTPNTEDLFNALPFPELNDARVGCKSRADNLCIDELRSIFKAPDKLLGKPKKEIYLELGAYQFTKENLYQNNKYSRHYLPISGPSVVAFLGGMFTDTFNNISNMLPPFPLLTQPENPIPKELICPEQCPDLCECLHLIKLELNSVVELVVVDVLSSILLEMDHSVHIHGHNFHVIKLGSKAEREVPDFYKNLITTSYPAIKDTVVVPAEGFAVVRFIADNPGFWPMHCHFTAHNHNGMMVIFQVGERKDFLPYPPDWPKCGDYLPPV